MKSLQNQLKCLIQDNKERYKKQKKLIKLIKVEKVYKKQKSCVNRIHLVTDDGLYDRKAFYTVKIGFYSSSMNDGKFINY